MAYPTLFLIRHGDAEHNALDVASSYPEKREYHLTELGRMQAIAVAETLSGERIDAILFSPMARTRETAEIIAEKTGAPLVEEPRLCEPGYGCFEGKSWKALVAKYPPPLRRLVVDESDGVESFHSLWNRLLPFCAEIAALFGGKRVAIVSHGDVLQMLHSILRGLTLGKATLSGKRFHRGEMLRMDGEGMGGFYRDKGRHENLS